MTTLDRDYFLRLMLELGQMGSKVWWVIVHVIYWQRTQNPFHMDGALVLWTEAGGTVGPIMQAVLAEVAEVRLNESPDEYSKLRGRPETVKRDIAKHTALLFMSFAVYLAVDPNRAALAASALHASVYEGKKLKASALKKYLERADGDRQAKDKLYLAFDEYAKYLKDIDGALWAKPFLDLVDHLVESGLGEAGVRHR